MNILSKLFKKKEPTIIDMPTDEEYKEWHDKCLRECPSWIVSKAVAFLKDSIPQNIKEIIEYEYRADPIHWCSPYHFSWGMFVRNQLRDNVCLDDDLPTKNFDDYYVRFIELAVGVIKIESK